jgi:hypothetical protein
MSLLGATTTAPSMEEDLPTSDIQGVHAPSRGQGLTTDETAQRPTERSPARRERTIIAARGRRVVGLAAIAVGAGVTVIVGRDGSPAWQLLRLAVVAAVTAAAYSALERSDRGRRATIAFTVGLLAAAVGAGIALPHLAKIGLHVLTVAGLLSLAAGIVLLVAGGLTLVRAVRSWKRVLAVPALLATSSS